MTKELKPCPFCPDGGVVVELKKDGKPTGIVAHCCHTLNRELRVPKDDWNTRYRRTCHFFPSFDRDIWGEEGAKHMLEERLAPPQPATLSTMDLPDCYECSACAWQVKQEPPAWMKCCPNCGAEVVDDD